MVAVLKLPLSLEPVRPVGFILPAHIIPSLEEHENRSYRKRRRGRLLRRPARATRPCGDLRGRRAGREKLHATRFCLAL